MKIAQALQVQKAISREMSHLESLEEQKSWSYRTRETPDAELVPNFDFEKNHENIKKLARLSIKVGQAISRTNLEVDVVGLSEQDLKDLGEWI